MFQDLLGYDTFNLCKLLFIWQKTDLRTFPQTRAAHSRACPSPEPLVRNGCEKPASWPAGPRSGSQAQKKSVRPAKKILQPKPKPSVQVPVGLATRGRA